VDAELVTLAGTAAAALVSTVDTAQWPVLRAETGRLLGRGDPAAEAVLLETLDEDAALLRAASTGDGTAGAVAARWTARLRDLLRTRPAAAGAVCELVEASGHSVAAGRDVHIGASFGAVAAGVIQQRQAAGHPVRLDPRVPHVAGRDGLLADLRERLVAGDPGVPATLALAGLGGVGKTTTALEYAHRHIGDYDLVWLLHAEETTALSQQVYELAEVLSPDRGGDPVARVHAELARRTNWLLILDNVRDHAAARRWLPAMGSGHVLVTTRDGHWPAGQRVEIGPLTLDAAAGFLVNQTGDPDLDAATVIATELGLLPLALAQAAAYVSTTGRSLADYRRLLTGSRGEQPS